MFISLLYDINNIKNTLNGVSAIILHVHVVIHHFKIYKKCNIFKIIIVIHK